MTTPGPYDPGAVPDGTLTGAELVELVSGAVFANCTTQQIANLGGNVPIGSLTIPAGKVVTINNTVTINAVDGKTVKFDKSLEFDGTDSTKMTFPTTSATIARTDAAQTFTGVQGFASMFTIPRATVAATGTNLGTAAQLANGYTTVTGADGTVGVKLVATPVAGSQALIKNASASALKVYPDAAATINAIGSNGPISMAANTIAIFIADGTTQWYTLPLVPS